MNWRTFQEAFSRGSGRPWTGRLWWTSAGFGRLPGGRALLSVAALISIIGSVSVARAGAGYVPNNRQPRFAPLNTNAKYLVLIVLDGARPDYFNLVPLPHLDALRASGTQYTHAFSGILESETPAAHATISTGSTPRGSGILGFSWAENDQNFSLFSPTVVRSGAMERIMQNAHAPTIAGLYKDRFPSATVVALSGHKYYAADPLGGPRADVIEYFRGTLQQTYAPTAIPGHVPPWQVFNDPRLTQPLNKLPFGQDDAMVTELALDTFASLHQRITLINYPDFDWPLGHVYGGNSDRTRVITLMRIFDNDLGAIEDTYRQAGILKQTLFVVTADHGMSPIQRFVPDDVITHAITAAGTTASSTSYNTAAYIWLRNFARAHAVANNIMKERDPGIQSTYYLTRTTNGLGYLPSVRTKLNPGVDAANRFLLATLMNGHEPTVVAFCRKRETTSNSSTHWRADHGGASWGAQHIPLVIAGPGIQRGLVTTMPAQLEDIAPTVLTTMGVPPTGMEGHVLTEAMQAPYAADLPDRTAEVGTLQPVVHALIAEDKAETRPKR